MRTAGGRQSAGGARQLAESVADLAQWVESLTGCPKVRETRQARCAHPSHGDDPATWFYVEADPAAGIARLRCLSGGHVQDVADSASRWTFPAMWSCRSCNQSIAEVVFGVHVEAEQATWLAVAVRCVECGEVAGVTDVVLAPTHAQPLLAGL